MTTTAPSGTGSPGRATIPERTLRTDRWWLQPLVTFTALTLFIIYSTFRAFENEHFFVEDGHLLSPFYAPCLSDDVACQGAPNLDLFPSNGFFTPALFILVFPLGFRLTCYYYRKAYYRAFWLSPPACAVSEPHKAYSGETRFPLVFQNVHRYFFYAGLVFNVLLTYEALSAFRGEDGDGFGMSVGTLVLVLNAALLWGYSLSCHSCRHIMGGRLKHFSKHPVRYRAWGLVSKLNGNHMKWAWVSLVWVAFTDFYIRSVSTGFFDDLRFFG